MEAGRGSGDKMWGRAYQLLDLEYDWVEPRRFCRRGSISEPRSFPLLASFLEKNSLISCMQQCPASLLLGVFHEFSGDRTEGVESLHLVICLFSVWLLICALRSLFPPYFLSFNCTLSFLSHKPRSLFPLSPTSKPLAHLEYLQNTLGICPFSSFHVFTLR